MAWNLEFPRHQQRLVYKILPERTRRLGSQRKILPISQGQMVSLLMPDSSDLILVGM